MTFPVVAALAVTGWVFFIVTILALLHGDKDAKAAVDQAHAYRNEAERVRRERDVLDAASDVLLTVAVDVWKERK